MPLVIAKVYYSQSEAEVAKSSLVAAGILATIFQKNINSTATFLNVTVGVMSLMVSDKDLEDAQGLLTLADSKPIKFEAESEAFRRNMPSGLFGLIVSYFFAWMPWWSRSRRNKYNVKDLRLSFASPFT